MVTTAQGNPLHVTLTPSHRHEAVKAQELIPHAQGKPCIGDSGNSSQAIIDAIRGRGMKAAIAPTTPTQTSSCASTEKHNALRYRVSYGFHALKR